MPEGIADGGAGGAADGGAGWGGTAIGAGVAIGAG
jgi:hypothetical protein